MGLDVEISAGALMLAALILIVAGIVNGATGFGFAQIGVVALALLLDPKSAVIILSVMSPVLAGRQLIHHRLELTNARRILWFLPAVLLGVPAGVLVLDRLPRDPMAILVGSAIVFFTALQHVNGRMYVPPNRERLLTPIVGFFAGLSNGALGFSGPVIGTYLASLRLTPATFAFVISALFVVMALLRLGLLFVFHEVTNTHFEMGVVLLAPSLAGQTAGLWLQHHVPASRIRAGVSALLIVSALTLVWRGLTSMANI